jgi:hypothetical protein
LALCVPKTTPLPVGDLEKLWLRLALRYVNQQFDHLSTIRTSASPEAVCFSTFRARDCGGHGVLEQRAMSNDSAELFWSLVFCSGMILVFIAMTVALVLLLFG